MTDRAACVPGRITPGWSGGIIVPVLFTGFWLAWTAVPCAAIPVQLAQGAERSGDGQGGAWTGRDDAGGRRLSTKGAGELLGALKLPLGLLIVVPIAPVLKYLVAAPPSLVFLAAAVAVAVLADWVRRSTEQVAEHVGPAIGGLLNVSFGSIAELILACSCWPKARWTWCRRRSPARSSAPACSGWAWRSWSAASGASGSSSSASAPDSLSSLLILVVIALLLPAVFDVTERSAAGSAARGRDGRAAQPRCLGRAAAALRRQPRLHAGHAPRRVRLRRAARGEGAWPLWRALAVLVAATAAIALEAELVSGALEATGARWAFRALPRRDRAGAGRHGGRPVRRGLVCAAGPDGPRAQNICVGSAIQVALVVAPLLVLVSWLMGTR